MDVLCFLREAKATQSMPDAYASSKVGSALQYLHIKNPLQFEAIYAQLTETVLNWTQRNLLGQVQKKQ